MVMKAGSRGAYVRMLCTILTDLRGGVEIVSVPRCQQYNRIEAIPEIHAQWLLDVLVLFNRR